MSRTSFLRRSLAVLAGGLAGALLVFVPLPARSADDRAPSAEAVERARTTVHMLDDLYKGFVVHITDIYVRAQERTPAAKVAKKVLEHMEEKGWGSGRLVDASGEPLNPGNRPKSEFEKRAVEQIKAGKPYYDEVGTKDGKPVLRAATVVPVVMKQCMNCHPAYKKEGQVIGSLVYEIPIK